MCQVSIFWKDVYFLLLSKSIKRFESIINSDEFHCMSWVSRCIQTLTVYLCFSVFWLFFITAWTFLSMQFEAFQYFFVWMQINNKHILTKYSIISKKSLSHTSTSPCFHCFSDDYNINLSSRNLFITLTAVQASQKIEVF